MTSPEIDKVGSMDGPLVEDTVPAYSLARWRIKNNFSARRGSEWGGAIRTTLRVDKWGFGGGVAARQTCLP